MSNTQKEYILSCGNFAIKYPLEYELALLAIERETGLSRIVIFEKLNIKPLEDKYDHICNKCRSKYNPKHQYCATCGNNNRRSNEVPKV